MNKIALFVTSVWVLASCADILNSDNGGQPTNAAEAQAYLSNKTNLYRHTDGTTEVEFTASDGTAYYWVVQNQQMVVGDWRVAEKQDGSYEICFRYPTGSLEYYSTLSGDPDLQNWGYWNCAPNNEILEDAAERANGNPLQLQEGPVPFVLEFEETLTMAEIATREGIDPNTIKYLPVYTAP